MKANQIKTSSYRKELYTEEAKRDRFERMAQSRTNKILNDLRLLGNTSNKGLYKYTESDVEKIFSTIEGRMAEIKWKFKPSKRDDQFRL